jgi:Zn-dependent alcohol dehydrogenase
MGVDVAVEALGKPQTFMQCTLSVKDGGKAVMIGLSQAGSVGEIDINRLVRRKVWGSYSLSLGLVRRKSLVLRLSFKIMILNLFLFCFSNFL